MHDFLGRNYRSDLALRSRPCYEWQFLVDAHGGNACMLSAWDNDFLVGILGYIPTLLFWGDFNHPILGAWCANWFVEKTHQQGLGVCLMRELEEIYPVVLSVGASSEGEPILKRMGWTCYRRLPRYLAVLDFEKAIQMLNPGFSTNDINPFSFIESFSETSKVRHLTLEVNDYRPDWHLYPAMAYGTIRSMQYFRWRYFEHPVFMYHVMRAGDTNRPAVCVYRIEQAFGVYEARVGRVVEFFHPNDSQGEEDGIALIHKILRRLKDEGCVYGDFTCSSHAYGQTLLKCGWQMEPADRQFLPVRLSPVEMKLRHQNLEFAVADGFPVPGSEQMYVTKSDGDEDRPARLPHLLPSQDDKMHNML